MSTTTTTQVLAATAKSGNEEADALHSAFRRAGAEFVKARRTFVEAAAAAKAGDVWRVRGFESWTAYVKATVKATGLKVTGEERDFLAVSLVALGVSERDTAEALGTSQATVNRSKSKPVGEEAAAAVEEVTGEAPATETTDKRGRTQSRTAKRGKGQTAKPAKPAKVPTSEVVANLAVILGDLDKRWQAGDTLAEEALKALGAYSVESEDAMARLVSRLAAK